MRDSAHLSLDWNDACRVWVIDPGEVHDRAPVLIGCKSLRHKRIEKPLDTLNTAPTHIDEFARFVRQSVPTGDSDERPETLKAWLDLAEAYRITQALRQCNGNRSAAARLLGIGRRTLYAKMDKLEIIATWRIA